MTADARLAETVTIGGDLTVGRVGYGAMQLTGPKVWGAFGDCPSLADELVHPRRGDRALTGLGSSSRPVWCLPWRPSLAVPSPRVAPVSPRSAKALLIATALRNCTEQLAEERESEALRGAPAAKRRAH